MINFQPCMINNFSKVILIQKREFFEYSIYDENAATQNHLGPTQMHKAITQFRYEITAFQRNMTTMRQQRILIPQKINFLLKSNIPHQPHSIHYIQLLTERISNTTFYQSVKNTNSVHIVLPHTNEKDQIIINAISQL